MIYLDNAATTIKKPPSVAAAVADAVCNMGNPGRGAHEESLSALRLVHSAREKLAELFRAPGPSSTAFTKNATESLNIAIQGSFQPGDHVITTALEHNSVLRPLYMMEERGVELTIIPADSTGNIKIADMEDAVRENTKGIVCTHVSNLTGNAVDLEEVGRLCKSHGILFIADASQSAGVLDIDMVRMNIGILCFTGHKALFGPQGVGGICLGEGVFVRPLMAGGSGTHTYSKIHPLEMPAALEAGTLNSHGIAGLYAALLYLEERGLEKIREKEQKLLKQFYEGMISIPKVKIYGDFSSFPRGAILSLNIGGYDSAMVADELLREYGISTRAGGHCAPLLHEALGTKEQGVIRFSFSAFNTEEEVRAAIRAVKQLSAD